MSISLGPDHTSFVSGACDSSAKVKRGMGRRGIGEGGGEEGYR